MFKRITWMGTGVAVGATSAFWAKRKVERTVARYRPGPVAQRAGESARTVGRTVREAASEGRDAMRAREAELRSAVESRGSAPLEPARRAPGAAPPNLSTKGANETKSSLQRHRR